MPTRSRFRRLVAGTPRARQRPAGPAVVRQSDARHLHLETLVGAQQPQFLAMGLHPRCNGFALSDEERHIVDEQWQADVEDLDVLLDRQPHAPGLVDLCQEQHQPELLLDEHRVAAPPMVQVQVLFERQKGQFDIPTSRVQLGDVAHTQQMWVEHIGHIAAHLLPIAKAHQAAEPTRTTAMPATQPHQGIQDLLVPVEGMHQLVGGIGAPTADKPERSFAQIIEPGEVEVAQVEEQQAANRNLLQQWQRQQRSLHERVTHIAQRLPLLGADVEERDQLARPQARIACWHSTQQRQMAGEPIQRAFIQSQDLAGEGGQRRAAVAHQALGQGLTDQAEELAHRLDACLSQALDQRVVGEGQRLEGTNGGTAQPAPPVLVAAHATEHAQQQAEPQMALAQHTWAATGTALAAHLLRQERSEGRCEVLTQLVRSGRASGSLTRYRMIHEWTPPEYRNGFDNLWIVHFFSLLCKLDPQFSWKLCPCGCHAPLRVSCPRPRLHNMTHTHQTGSDLTHSIHNAILLLHTNFLAHNGSTI